MRKALIIIVIIAVIAALSLLYYFMIYLPSKNVASEGTGCKIGLMPGTIKNGKCVANAPKAETIH